MTDMRSSRWFGLFLAGGLLTAALPADALLLTPDLATVSHYQNPPGNCEPACVNSYFGTSFTSANLLYKSEDGKLGELAKEEGSFLSFYTTRFSPQSDAEDALISWDGGSSMSCSVCILAVKDGKQDPNYYFFDLSALLWNGTDSLELRNFWLGRGAISHVSIWGKASVSVPEPATLILFGGGLVAVAGFGRRRHLWQKAE